jgi:hypothetical protein
MDPVKVITVLLQSRHAIEVSGHCSSITEVPVKFSMDGFKGLAYRSNIFGVVTSMNEATVAAQLFKNSSRDMYDRVTGDRTLYNSQIGVQSVHIQQLKYILYYTIIV